MYVCISKRSVTGPNSIRNMPKRKSDGLGALGEEAIVKSEQGRQNRKSKCRTLRRTRKKLSIVQERVTGRELVAFGKLQRWKVPNCRELSAGLGC